MLLKETQTDENGESVLVSSKTVRAQLKTLEAAVDGFLKQRKIGYMAMNMEMDLTSALNDLEEPICQVE